MRLVCPLRGMVTYSVLFLQFAQLAYVSKLCTEPVADRDKDGDYEKERKIFGFEMKDIV